MTESSTRTLNLQWNSDTGVGYFPVDQFLDGENPYDQAYLETYQSYEGSPIWAKLNNLRLKLVSDFTKGTVLDVGCGAGHFVELRQKTGMDTFGYDIIPEAITSLLERGLWGELETVHALSFWDSLEHIKDWQPVVDLAEEWVFVSIPIFKDKAGALKSKHYKPREHFHYFTHKGLVGAMWDRGLRIRAMTDGESRAGRHGIRSFAFQRVRNP